ncbi:hypothetical protein LDENG_00296230 [Lucifuga dentata]|nr:hypothetical protein LDENG_00296230 [Lucifuga dentata]
MARGQHDVNRLCFGLNAGMENNPTELQPQQMDKELNPNISFSHLPFYSDTFPLMPDNTLRSHEGDQVVPSSQRRSVFGSQQKEPKPLPPLPDPEELMSDEAADSEVEFFTSERHRLLPKSCPKALCRGGYRGYRGYGQVNYAYQESMLGAGSSAFSWPGTEDRGTGRGTGLGANGWTLTQQEPDHSLSSRFSCSGPASHLHQNSITDKPQIPPRVPIPPRPPSLSKTTSEDDKPPKIPPRVPLVPPCPPRTPSPKSLPIYINGVMPATQSFAANPKYVSKALQRHQSERAPPAAQRSPCIVPIMKDGRQASTTHYILLPGRPAYTDRRGRLFSEPAKKSNATFCQNR